MDNPLIPGSKDFPVRGFRPDNLPSQTRKLEVTIAQLPLPLRTDNLDTARAERGFDINLHYWAA